MLARMWHGEGLGCGASGCLTGSGCLALLGYYLLFAFSLMTLARRTRTPDETLAWIPVLNVWLVTQIARRPGWWTALVFVPVVNVAIWCILWMEIARRLGHPEWLGLLMWIPVVNLGVVAWLAFGEPARGGGAAA